MMAMLSFACHQLLTYYKESYSTGPLVSWSPFDERCIPENFDQGYSFRDNENQEEGSIPTIQMGRKFNKLMIFMSISGDYAECCVIINLIFCGQFGQLYTLPNNV